MDVLIGLDLGTTKLCAVAFDAQAGRLLGVEETANDAALPSRPGEQDARAVAGKAIRLLAALAKGIEHSTARVVGIGVTGQMHGVVLVDESGTAVTPLVTWQDSRGDLPFKATGRTYAEETAQRLGPEALHRAGCRPATGYGGVTLFRLLHERSLPKRCTALTIQDFIVRKLCGKAVTDPADAASWGVYDVENDSSWLPEAGEALGIPRGLLPEVVPTGSKAGPLESSLAAATGLPAGIPVGVATGDNQASFLTSAPSTARTALFNLGTGGQMSIASSRFVRAGALETRPLTHGRWLLVGASLCGGHAYRILENFFADVGKRLFGVESDLPLYDVMNRLANEAGEDCGGMRVRTLFSGTRLDPSLRASVEGLDPENLTAANLIRAVVAGMVGELVEFYQAAGKEGVSADFLAGSGNAVRRNPLVVRELERKLDMPLHLPPHREEAAVGAALLGGMAAGVYRDWEEIGELLFPNR